MKAPEPSSDQLPIPTNQPVLTMSSAYGAGGSVISPALAETLGLPFCDRLLSTSVVDDATASENRNGSVPDRVRARAPEGISEAEKEASPGSRFFSYLARAAAPTAYVITAEAYEDEPRLRRHAEADVVELCRTSGGVILGRAGAVILAKHPRAFHVRLAGPKQRRARRAAEIEGVSEEEALQRLEQTDRARELWVRRLYRADATDPRYYHLVLDSTVFSVEEAVDIVAGMARTFWRHH